METLLPITCLVLAAVFAAAGLSKLTDRQGARRALVDFGTPQPLAAPLAVVLPIGELLVAASLVIRPTALAGSMAAVALLAIFVIAIGVNLALGRRPDCHCFGQLSSGPVGWTTLLRNMVLLSAAGFAVWGTRSDSGPTALEWLISLMAPERLWVLVLVGMAMIVAPAAWLSTTLLRQYGRLLLRVEALERQLSSGAAVPQGMLVGTPAPEFTLGDVNGRRIALADLRARELPVVLMFTDPKCGPCSHLLPDIARWQDDHARQMTIALISRRDAKANIAALQGHDIDTVLLQNDSEIAEQYHAPGTPSAVVVSPGGTIATSLAVGADAIRLLVGKLMNEPAVPAPEIESRFLPASPRQAQLQSVT